MTTASSHASPTSTPSTAPVAPLTRAGRTLAVVMSVALLALVAFALAWWLRGGRIENVESPSMGTRAPVGSLLWVERVDAADLRPGDFISFTAPGTDTVYSHLVRTVAPDGTLTTGGLLSGDDPWRLHAPDVVGRISMVWPGAGWVARAGPVLIVGILLVATAATIASRHRPRWRIPIAWVGASVVLAVALVAYQPLTHVERLALDEHADGGPGIRASFVGTGLLPVRVSTVGSEEGAPSRIVLRNGEVGSLVVRSPAAPGRYEVRMSPAVPWPFWIALVGLCFVPAVVDTARRARRRALDE